MYFFIFIRGGTAYNILEYIWRGYTHWTMTIAGGICLTGIYAICTLTGLNYIYKVVTCAAFITAIEFISGLIINKYFKLNVWDYSDIPYNILGQICPRYSVLWLALCIPVVAVIDVISSLYTR